MRTIGLLVAFLAFALPAESAAAAVDTFVEAGPSGLTRDTTPSFTFGSNAVGATFECRVDGPGSPLPDFRGCSSPLVVPRLAGGEYVFAVRARVRSGEADQTPAARAFTVDAEPPETTLTDGPAEDERIDDRTPTLRYASEPGARFECRLDNRAVDGLDTVPWALCAADGFTASTLSGGRHVFEVRAVDAAGNADPSPARRSFEVRACERVVRFGVVEAEAECLAAVGTADAPRWISEGDVRLNGLSLPAPGPARIVLDGPSAANPGGAVTADDVTLSVEGVTLYRGRFAWKLPEGGPGDEREVARFDLSGENEQIRGLEVKGDVALRLRRSASDRFKAVFVLHVALPAVFRAGPEEGAGGVTGDVSIDVDREGVHLGGLKVAVANAYIGRLGVRSVCLSFVAAGGQAVAPCQPPALGRGSPAPFLECRADTEADRWDGAAVIVLPTPSATELGVWAGLRAGRLSHAGALVDNLGTSVPLVPGVFLQRVALGVCLEPPPFQIKGAAGIAFGPDFQGRPAARLDGSFLYVDAWNGRPRGIRADGSLTLFDRRVAGAWITYQGTGLLDLGFDAQLRFGPVRMEGGVAGWVETTGQRRFSVTGTVLVCVDAVACADAAAVISSIGAAGCITVTVMSVPVLVKDPDWTWYQPWKVHWESQPVTVTGGAGYTWQTGRLDLMGGSCSIGRWQLARPAQLVDGSQLVQVPAGENAVSLRVRGLGAPPKVTLVGPDGRRIETPDRPGGELVEQSHLIAENPADSTTNIMVTRPAGGVWRVERQPGSSPVLGVERADALAEPTLRAGVGGRGHRRRLGYVYSPQDGQRITFVERAAGDSSDEHPLGEAAGGQCPEEIPGRGQDRVVRCGQLRFEPGPGPSGEREIVALVSQGGVPRKRIVVASYRAPTPRRPGRPAGTSIRRRGRTVTIRWTATGASDVSKAIVRVGDGRRLLFVRDARTSTARVRGVSRRDGVSVAVRGLRDDSRVGPEAIVRLEAGDERARGR